MPSTNGGGGLPSPLPTCAEVGYFSETSSGVVHTSDIGAEITVHGVTLFVPWIPFIPCAEAGNVPYIQPIALTNASSIFPKAPNIGVTCIVTISCAIGKVLQYVGGIVTKIPTYLFETLEHYFDKTFNFILSLINGFLGDVWNASTGVLNAIFLGIDVPIALFDGFSKATGEALLGLLFWVPEPFSIFVTPLIWAVVFIVFVGLIWLGWWLFNEAKSGIELGAEVAA
ncbi:MAG: hypothetical protein JRN58_09870 [Nitrososphaerota archaeon]|nr:hypothetical protein [Nitrososphaerota archaeon]MDG6979373.1 hypothetical protein [Nitrososphaerota archaeon]